MYGEIASKGFNAFLFRRSGKITNQKAWERLLALDYSCTSASDTDNLVFNGS